MLLTIQAVLEQVFEIDHDFQNSTQSAFIMKIMDNLKFFKVKNSVHIKIQLNNEQTTTWEKLLGYVLSMCSKIFHSSQTFLLK